MALSSSSLFHFTTKGFVGLDSILRNGFRVSVCTETKRYNLGPYSDYVERMAVPMVCFCDIPLSLIDRHSKVYCKKDEGVFAIGMTKDWGMENKLNPLIYLTHESMLNWHLQRLSYVFEKIASDKLVIEKIRDRINTVDQIDLDLGLDEDILKVSNKFIDVLTVNVEKKIGLHKVKSRYPYIGLFFKPYSDKYDRVTDDLEEYNFYNEREWRFIPSNLNPIRISLNPDYDIERYCIKYNNFTSEELYKSANEYFMLSADTHNYHNLLFMPDDISWIIVPSEKIASEFIKMIMDKNYIDMGGNVIRRRSENEKLVQKIISYERIQNDIFSH